MAAKEAALSKWAHAREYTIDLPSGAGKAIVKALDLTEAVALGRIPNGLTGIAMKAEGGALTESELTAEEVKEWFELKCSVVAIAVVEFRPKRATNIKGPLELEFVRDSMPPDDRDTIFQRATHVLTASQLMGLMSLSGFRGGEVSPEPPGGGDINGEASE